MTLCLGANAATEPVDAAAAPTAVAPQKTAVCKGKVLDKDGEPVIGASVKLAGSSKGVSTDIDGNFNLGTIKVGSTVEITYVGCKKQSIRFSGSSINVVLQDDETVLDEVVVMGYGVAQKRAKVTNSISTVSEDVLTIGANANPAQALAGAVSGMKVYVQSGDPTATPTIVLRGGSNFDGSGSPLIVIDGQIRSSFDDINSNDIESMDVLKDAGATALYGARAAGGVILITTKQGKKGTRKITFNAKYGINYYDAGYDYVDFPTYLTWYRTSAVNTPWYSGDLNSTNTPYGVGRTSITSDMVYNIMTQTEDNKYLLNKGWKSMTDPIDPTRTLMYRETNLMDYNLNMVSATQDYNVSMSGGNDRGTYYAGLGYYDADGSIYSSWYKRYTFSFTGSYKIADWLTSDSKLNFQRSNWSNGTGNLAFYSGVYDYTSGLYNQAASLPQNIRLVDEDGNELLGLGANTGSSLNGLGANYHLIADKFYNYYEDTKFAMTTSLTAQICKGLTLKGTMSWYYDDYYDKQGTKDYPQNQEGTSWNTDRYVGIEAQRNFNQTYNIVANYKNTFGNGHNVNAMLGAEYYDGTEKGVYVTGTGMDTDDFLNIADTDVETHGDGDWTYKERIASQFGRLEYDYQDKYLVAATFRNDGYSRLLNNRWGFFPGVSAGWVFTKEKFFSNLISENILNYGKIRSSYGVSGYVNSSYISYYNLQGAYSNYRYSGTKGYRISTLANPNLQWEKTKTFEVGLDLGFLKNRINLNATYYNRLNDNKVATLSLPQTTGFSSVTYNNGSYRNQGVELDLTAHIINTRDWRWSITANLAYNKNTIVSLPDNGLLNNRQGGTEVYVGKDAWHYVTNANGTTSIVWDTQYIGGYQEGQEPGSIIGYKVDHMVRNQSQIPANYIDITPTKKVYSDETARQRLLAMGYSESQLVALAPGDLVFYDVNGDGMIDTKDRMKLGNSRPHWNGGFNTTLSWKGLQLYARFDMGWGFTVYDTNIAQSLGGADGTLSFLTYIEDTWTPTNVNAKYPRHTWNDNSGVINYYGRISSLLCQSGAYLACRELQLSYNLPTHLCHRFHSQGLQLSITGQNLGYIKASSLPLPDNSNTTYATSYAGYGGTYNLQRTVLFGINMSF